MQAEQEIKRNFCYNCKLKIADNSSYCPKCFNQDLIPAPQDLNNKWIEDWKEKNKPFIVEPDSTLADSKYEGTVLSTFEEKPKIEIDSYVKEGLQKPFAFLTGEAGSGKTTAMQLMAALDPNYIELTSTTGIAAINCGGRTVHSTLKFFNLKSLENNSHNGKLQWELRKIRDRKRVLGIEEVSMLGAQQANIILSAVDEINNDRTGKKLGVHFIGDLAQLPPVKKAPDNLEFVFKSQYWDRFANNTIKLTKIWRQTDPDFINAMNLVRVGKGKEAIDLLAKCGVTFKNEVDGKFDGTTLISLNDKVDDYNTKRLSELSTPMIRTVAKRFGIYLNEWDKIIPAEFRTKIGAYVMILSNDIPKFNYVNGDTGTIVDYDSKSDKFFIELVRTKQVVKIGRLSRENITDRKPTEDNFTGNFHPYVDQKTSDWVVGIISFHPIRSAWASTIHKAQGLSLDKVQIDTSHQFFSQPSMAYVAMSRVRTPEGLFLIGKPENIARKINVDKEIVPYL